MTNPKTIVFDLRALQIGHENRGIGMVAKSVLANLEDETNNYIFYIFDSSNPIKDLGIGLKIKNYIFVETPRLKTTVESPSDLIDSFKFTFHRFTPLRDFQPNVFLQFDFALGIPSWRGTKTICIGYDLIPLIMRNQYLPSPRMAWNQPGGRRARIKKVLRSFYYLAKARRNYSNFRRADKILCISEATKQSFVDILSISPKKLATVPLAPVTSDNKTDDSIAKKLSKPYLFYIGGTDSRKRISDIIHAFNIAKGRGMDISLALAGNEFKEVEKIPDVAGRNAILKSPYRDDIHLLGFVTDEQKYGLYENALAFVFTSSYEGFGLPVIEAMQAKCPVISYDNSSIPEAAGDAAILVATGNYLQIAKEIPQLLDGTARDRLINKGEQQAKKFSWDQYVSTLLSTFNN